MPLCGCVIVTESVLKYLYIKLCVAVLIILQGFKNLLAIKGNYWYHMNIFNLVANVLKGHSVPAYQVIKVA